MWVYVCARTSACLSYHHLGLILGPVSTTAEPLEYYGIVGCFISILNDWFEVPEGR